MSSETSARAKSGRKVLPSALMADKNNTEGLSTVQKQALATKPVLDLIKRILRLAGPFPDSVPEASESDDKIHHVVNNIHGIDKSVHGTLNPRFDNLFGKDTRENDRLKFVRRGDRGMVLVVQYLETIHWQKAGIPLDLAQLKLERVVNELEFLWYAVKIGSRHLYREARGSMKAETTSQAMLTKGSDHSQTVSRSQESR
ncbi:hypothetical protein K438DRAFT_2000785 [Mycena galopus ATCC 62051]|nr:hypothetical protein K438DRAFT_2000785 [Mycena galopus ATCC 62051]